MTYDYNFRPSFVGRAGINRIVTTDWLEEHGPEFTLPTNLAYRDGDTYTGTHDFTNATVEGVVAELPENLAHNDGETYTGVHNFTGATVTGIAGGSSLFVAPTDVGSRAGVFDPMKSLYLPSEDSMDAVRAKIALAAAGTGRCKIAWVGTSIVAGFGSTVGTNSPPVMLRKFLERRYGALGSGLVPATVGINNPNANLSSMDDARYSFTGVWNNPGVARAEDMQFHISSTTLTSTLTFTSQLAGTIVEIFYFNNSRPFSYTIDGGGSTVVTPTGTNALTSLTVSGLSNSTHTVTITIGGVSGTLFILGVNVRPANALEVAGLGYYGASTTDWLPTSITSAFYNGHNVVLGYAPQIALVQLGPNELIHSLAGGSGTVETNLTTILTAYQAAGILPVLVVDPPIESGAVSGWSTSYRSGIYDVADAKDVPLIDLTHAWRNRAAGAANGYYADQWHPTPAGSTAMAEAIAAALAR